MIILGTHEKRETKMIDTRLLDPGSFLNACGFTESFAKTKSGPRAFRHKINAKLRQQFRDNVFGLLEAENWRMLRLAEGIILSFISTDKNIGGPDGD
jgi:hypothetical protein